MDNLNFRALYIRDRAISHKLNEEELNTMFEKLAICEERCGKRIEDSKTRDDFMQLFSNMNISSINTFLYVKSRLKSYLKWLLANKLAEPNIQAISDIRYSDVSLTRAFESRFFKDFHSLQRSIDDAIYIADRIDEYSFATQIVAIYLAWYGVTAEEAVEIKKADVGEDFIKVGDRIIRPNSIAMSYIRDYCNAIGYETQARYVIQVKYLPSQYLLRTTRKEHITPKGLSVLLALFSQYAVDSSDSDEATFAYSKIYWSGIYCRAHIYESEYGEIKTKDIDTISRVFRETYSTQRASSRRLKNYQSFKKYFYPDAKAKK